MNNFRLPEAAKLTKHLKEFCFSSISHQPKFIKCDIIHVWGAGRFFKAKVIKHGASLHFAHAHVYLSCSVLHVGSHLNRTVSH